MNKCYKCCNCIDKESIYNRCKFQKTCKYSLILDVNTDNSDFEPKKG